MILVAVPQHSPAWFEARLGVTTASRAADACEWKADGEPSQKLLNYAAQVATELIARVSYDDTYVNAAMRRGTALEGDARRAYEVAKGELVEEAGIYLTDDRRFGYSSDGLVGKKGCIEIKCPSSAAVVLQIWKTGNLADYMHQIQFGLWLTGREWCDFIMYDPRLESVGKSLYVKRVPRDEAFIEEMERRLMRFKAIVDDLAAVLRAPVVETEAPEFIDPELMGKATKPTKARLNRSAAPVVAAAPPAPAPVSRFEALSRRIAAAPSRASCDLILDGASDLDALEYSELYRLAAERFPVEQKA